MIENEYDGRDSEMLTVAKFSKFTNSYYPFIMGRKRTINTVHTSNQSVVCALDALVTNIRRDPDKFEGHQNADFGADGRSLKSKLKHRFALVLSVFFI